MKKRILSLLLVMAMLVGMTVLPVYAEETATCPCCNTAFSAITDWQAWPTSGTISADGHYRLTASGDTYGQVQVTGGKVILDLNGFTLSTVNNSTTAVRPLYAKGGELHVYDTSEEKTGTVIGKQTSTGGAVYVHKDGTMHIYGGTFKNNAAYCANGGVVNVAGKLTLHDGVIEGKKSNFGGALQTSGTFTMEGGSITGGESTGSGGTVQVNGGTFTLNGGTIGAGTAATSGGTIFAQGGTLNLNGGTVESGTVGSGKYGKAVYAGSCTVNIGSVDIPDAVSSNVAIGSGVTLSISGAPKIGYMSINAASAPTIGAMTDGAQVQLAVTDTMALAEANDQMADYVAKGYFLPFTAGKVFTTDNASLTVADYDCPCCDAETVTWTAWTGTAEDGKHYYLAEDLALTASISVAANTSATLDLRGKKITSETDRAFTVRGNLDIVDSGVTGTVTAGTTGTNGGIFSVQDTGNVELHGGTYVGQAAPKKGSVAYVLGAMTVHQGVTLDGNKVVDEATAGSTVYVNGGTYTMDGGAVIGATAKRGGSIFVEKGALNITGGSISGGKVAAGSTGADIYVQAATDVTLADCTVADEVHINAADAVNVSGSVVLNRLKLSEGVLLTLGELTEGTDISVAGTGAFTVANENAQAYLDANYIKSANAGSVLVVTDNVFKFLTENDPKCPHCGEYMEKINWTAFNAAAVKGNGGHFYLTKDITRTQQLQINAGVDSVIDLRDHNFTVTTAGVRGFVVFGSLTIMDTVDSGIVTGLGNGNGGTYNVQPGGELYLLGGTSTAGADASLGGVIYTEGTVKIDGGIVGGGKAVMNASGENGFGGNIYAASGAKVIFASGNVQNGSSDSYGGNIYIASGAEMDLSGGVVKGGTGDVAAKLTSGFRGDNIYVEGVLNMTEGHITVTNTDCFGNAVLARGTATVNIAGDPNDYSDTTSGNIHLLSTCTLNAEFGAQMIYRYGRIGWYKTTALAVEDFGNHENHRYVKLLFARDVTIADKEVYLDVNGLEVNVTVNAGGTFYGLDSSATVEAAGTGSATVTGEGAVAVDTDLGSMGRYLALTRDGKTTFHQIEFNIDEVALRTSAMGFYYRTKLDCDPVLGELVSTYGVALSVHNVPGADFDTEANDNNRYTFMEGDTFESGKVITSGSVFNVMKESLSAEKNKVRGEMKVYANAYVRIDLDGVNEATIMSDTKNADMKAGDEGFTGIGYSMYDVMKSLDDSYSELTETEQADVKSFYETWYTKGMGDWDISNFSPIKVGFGRADITPDYTVHISGGNLATRYSTDVKDPLYVTCIAVTDENGETALMITQDLINAEIAYSTRTMVAEATGVPFKHIMIAATHTHSAPSTAGDYENVDAYKQLYQAAVVEAAQAALADRGPAVAQTGSVTARTETDQQLVFVRRYKQLLGGYRGGYGTSELNPISEHAYDANETMQIVKFVRGSGKKDILMTNLGAHATFNGETTMTSLSADFPGAIRSYVESNSDCLSAHFISGGADQNPVSLLSDNHSFDYIGYGEAVAKIALGATLHNMDAGDVKFASKQVTVDSNKKDVNDTILAKAEEADAVYQADGFAAGEEKAIELGFNGIYHARSFISRNALPDTQTLGINALAIGQLSFVFASYEMFGCNAADLIAASPYENTFVVTCANNSGGYVPADKAYDMGCYESYTARVARGSAEILVNEFVALLNTLHG